MKEDLRILWFLLLIFLALASCEDSVADGEYDGITGIITNMPQLPEDYEYATWLIENDNIRFMRTVAPDDEGTIRLAYAPLSQHIEEAKVILVSIEVTSSNYTLPSRNEIVACKFNQSDQANVSAYVISQDFSGLSGSFILDTPTDSSTDEKSGVWFQNEDGTPGLQLSILEEGWQYEAWVIIDGKYVSIGKFNDANSVDLSNYYGGTDTPYNVPGEDFTNNDLAPDGLEFPLDLTGKEVVITLEPFPDFSEEPFGLVALHQVIDNTVELRKNISMENRVNLLPSGSMTKER